MSDLDDSGPGDGGDYEVVTYEAALKWIKQAKCKQCGARNLAWVSSGMSQCFPHFHCDRCSNAYHADNFKGEIYANAPDEALLAKIAKDLPDCPCGGRFRPGATAKCRNCQNPLGDIKDAVANLVNPNVVIPDGAVFFSSSRKPYQVKIETGLLDRLGFGWPMKRPR